MKALELPTGTRTTVCCNPSRKPTVHILTSIRVLDPGRHSIELSFWYCRRPESSFCGAPPQKHVCPWFHSLLSPMPLTHVKVSHGRRCCEQRYGHFYYTGLFQVHVQRQGPLQKDASNPLSLIDICLIVPVPHLLSRCLGGSAERNELLVG